MKAPSTGLAQSDGGSDLGQEGGYLSYHAFFVAQVAFDYTHHARTDDDTVGARPGDRCGVFGLADSKTNADRNRR